VKKEGNHKRAQRVQKGVKTESYKKGGPVLFLCQNLFLRFEKRKAKGTKEEKKNGEKKSLKN
tara:strand:- start:390 stop:575 length:186 start_codon:yes stop_codon:yes gene_type:complete